VSNPRERQNTLCHNGVITKSPREFNFYRALKGPVASFFAGGLDMSNVSNPSRARPKKRSAASKH